MNYAETLGWLYGLQTLGIKLGLDNVRQLLGELNLARPEATVIHVAGTNGKGSTCAMIDAICRAAGRRSGFFSSPHLVSYRERIRSDGRGIPEADVVRHAATVRELCAGWEAHPTFFEVTLAIALMHFREQQADVIVLETGLGGRLDATNAVSSDVTAITAIGMDHQQLLGSTLGEIAAEKAGIFKPHVPAVCAPQEEAAAAVLKAKAAAVGAPFYPVTEPWTASPLALRGAHQGWNAAAAVVAVRLADPGIGEAAIRQGLATAHWPGRFQKIALAPATELILDGAHNEAGIRVLLDCWHAEFGRDPVPVVVGIAESKNTAAMLALLQPLASELILTGFESPRASDPLALRDQLPPDTPAPRICAGVAEMLATVRSLGAPRVLVVGSLFLIGETLAQLGGSAFEASLQ